MTAIMIMTTTIEIATDYMTVMTTTMTIMKIMIVRMTIIMTTTINTNEHFFAGRCECIPGFTGKNCSENVDDCKSHVCLNGATCVDGLESYTCMCPPGFSGQYCEIAPVLALPNYDSAGLPGHGACKYHECQNNAVCFQPKGSPDYMCKCAPGRHRVVVAMHCLMFQWNPFLRRVKQSYKLCYVQ
jgi:hypothetical protein